MIFSLRIILSFLINTENFYFGFLSGKRKKIIKLWQNFGYQEKTQNIYKKKTSLVKNYVEYKNDNFGA